LRRNPFIYIATIELWVYYFQNFRKSKKISRKGATTLRCAFASLRETSLLCGKIISVVIRINSFTFKKKIKPYAA
jgi:hypothetical protein